MKKLKVKKAFLGLAMESAKNIPMGLIGIGADKLLKNSSTARDIASNLGIGGNQLSKYYDKKANKDVNQQTTGQAVTKKQGGFMKKAKDESKLHENKESTMKEGKETMMEKKGYKETPSGKMVKAAKGALTKSQKKIGKVMKEFKSGELHSGKSGPVVKNPKQAIAIALSEAGKSKMKKAAEGDMMGGLSGKQSKLDANKDGQISGEDFKMLRTKNKRGGGMAERGMGASFSQGGSVRGVGAAIRGTRPAKLY